MALAPALDVGSNVDVWCPSTQAWSPGFRVVGVDDDGVRVVRVSDGEELPAVFSSEQIRVAHALRDRHAVGWAGPRRLR